LDRVCEKGILGLGDMYEGLNQHYFRIKNKNLATMYGTNRP